MNHPHTGNPDRTQANGPKHWFSVVESRWRGEPVLEILQDGRPFHVVLDGHKSRFRFGVRKARMLLACLREIRVFYASGGTLPVTLDPLTVHSRPWQCDCMLSRHEGFKRGGHWQAKPWLKIASGNACIGIGVSKAEAVLFLEAEIERFVLQAG